MTTIDDDDDGPGGQPPPPCPRCGKFPCVCPPGGAGGKDPIP